VNIDNASRVNIEHFRELRCWSLTAGSASANGEMVAMPAGLATCVPMAESAVMKAR